MIKCITERLDRQSQHVRAASIQKTHSGGEMTNIVLSSPDSANAAEISLNGTGYCYSTVGLQ